MNDPLILQFLNAAEQRLEAAEALLLRDLCRDSIYLAGISVECALKSLLLSHVPAPKRKRFVNEQFRGRGGHSYDKLVEKFKQRGGSLPAEWDERDLRRLRDWSVNMRYETFRIPPREAHSFFEAAKRIVSSIMERVR